MSTLWLGFKDSAIENYTNEFLLSQSYLIGYVAFHYPCLKCDPEVCSKSGSIHICMVFSDLRHLVLIKGYY